MVPLSTDDEKPPVKRTGKKRSPRALAAEENVVALFGDNPRIPEHPDDPDGVRPINPGPKSGKRKRVRMGRRMSEMYDEIQAGEITMAQVIETMDPEELARGQLKAKDGSFRGAPPKWVPSEFHAACMKEMLKRGQALYRGHYMTAIEAFTEIAKDKSVEPQHRLKAAQYIWDRVEGKIPDKVEIGAVSEPWEQIIGGIVAEAEDANIARATQILGGTS